VNRGELIIDVAAILQIMGEKAVFNATRQSEAMSGLIRARIVGVKGVAL
jgi:hypothetical protein